MEIAQEIGQLSLDASEEPGDSEEPALVSPLSRISSLSGQQVLERLRTCLEYLDH